MDTLRRDAPPMSEYQALKLERRRIARRRRLRPFGPCINVLRFWRKLTRGHKLRLVLP